MRQRAVRLVLPWVLAGSVAVAGAAAAPAVDPSPGSVPAGKAAGKPGAAPSLAYTEIVARLDPTAHRLEATATVTLPADDDALYPRATAAAAGDLDGDRLADFVLGAVDTSGVGVVSVLYGPVAGAFTVGMVGTEIPHPTVAWFGYSVAAATDMDGDGAGDLLVGGQGAAWLFSGATLGG